MPSHRHSRHFKFPKFLWCGRIHSLSVFICIPHKLRIINGQDKLLSSNKCVIYSFLLFENMIRYLTRLIEITFSMCLYLQIMDDSPIDNITYMTIIYVIICQQIITVLWKQYSQMGDKHLHKQETWASQLCLLVVFLCIILSQE